jgi:hypothetical protein
MRTIVTGAALLGALACGGGPSPASAPVEPPRAAPPAPPAAELATPDTFVLASSAELAVTGRFQGARTAAVGALLGHQPALLGEEPGAVPSGRFRRIDLQLRRVDTRRLVDFEDICNWT